MVNTRASSHNEAKFGRKSRRLWLQYTAKIARKIRAEKLTTGGTHGKMLTPGENPRQEGDFVFQNRGPPGG